LTNTNDENYFKFIDLDDSVKDKLILEHIIDLMNRQLKFIAPHVLMRGYNYRLLLHKPLTDFALSVNNNLLEEQYLYKKMLSKEFPKLFSIPIKSNIGLPLNAGRARIMCQKLINKTKKITNIFITNFPNPNINYIDFDEGIRNRDDLKKIIYENIMDLKIRKVVDWVNIDEIWEKHQSKKYNHADALIVLASLEIHLKAGKKI
jgi:hypothetical protein